MPSSDQAVEQCGACVVEPLVCQGHSPGRGPVNGQSSKSAKDLLLIKQEQSEHMGYRLRQM